MIKEIEVLFYSHVNLCFVVKSNQIISSNEYIFQQENILVCLIQVTKYIYLKWITFVLRTNQNRCSWWKIRCMIQKSLCFYSLLIYQQRITKVPVHFFVDSFSDNAFFCISTLSTCFPDTNQSIAFLLQSHNVFLQIKEAIY